MQIKSKFLVIVLSLFLTASFSLAHAQKISADQLKKNIQERLAQRNELIKDYQCDIVIQSVSATPRGEMEMESNYKLYFKCPDKRKLEFVGGKRDGREISADDMNRRRGTRGNRGGRRGFRNQPAPLKLSKYLDSFKIVGTDKVNGTDTYKIAINVADKEDRFKSLTVWIDQKTFDVVKYKGKLRKNDRLQSGIITRVFAPIGPEGVWMPVKEKWERYMVFTTPRGEMEIESAGTTKFKNYQFNIGLKEDIFDTQK